MIESAHARAASDVLRELGVQVERGLDREQVAARLQQYGRNRLPDAPRESAWARLLRQLKNPLVLTLLVSAIVAVWVGSTQTSSFLARYGNALAIIVIVILNALLGFVQEGRAEAALDALQKMVTIRARARRSGEIVEVDAAELVPGDILELEAGDAVPADARLVASTDLEVEEAALTGESQAVSKQALAVVGREAALADRRTVVHLGTTVTRGKARAVVVGTASSTELGRIGGLLAQIERVPTPLEHRLAAFDERILYACLGVSVALVLLGMARGDQPWPQLLLQGVSLAVAIIPEGLPAITTITLGLGMQRMAERGAVVRRLPAVETLGTANVICTDKTGTLTQNQMTVRRIWCAGVEADVTGEGYDPRGSILRERGTIEEALQELLLSATLCNGATLREDEDTRTWKVIGDPTEGALLVLAHKGGLSPEQARAQHSPVVELPFEADRKRMTVVTRDGSGVATAHVKGSVEVVLRLCASLRVGGSVRPLAPGDRAAILEAAERMSKRALRTLAIARREQPDVGDPERDLVFLGLVGMMDPPRSGVAEAVAACRAAGVRTIMITGDHPTTAGAVARELNIIGEREMVMTGAELDAVDPTELQSRLAHVAVFARTTPEQKLKIVRALKAGGAIVAMTGDGVNDAPALREAHIGVAMGKSGTDVARQAADIVLTDDNFATLVSAIAQGRSIYRNIQKFIFFLLSSNAGLALTVFAVSSSSHWLTLTPLMILWINLVTNGLPALALGLDSPDPRQMLEPPRRADEPLLRRADYIGVAFVGCVMAAMALWMYALPPPGHGLHPEGHRALAFSVLALAPLLHAWSCRSPSASIVSGPISLRFLAPACAMSAMIHFTAVMVPALQPIFATFPLSWSDWLYLVILSSGIVPAVEVAKAVQRRRSEGRVASALGTR